MSSPLTARWITEHSADRCRGKAQWYVVNVVEIEELWKEEDC